jgi:subtilisin family serine protease
LTAPASWPILIPAFPPLWFTDKELAMMTSGRVSVSGRLRAAGFALGLLLIAGVATAADKLPVRSLDDLPRHAYKVTGKVSELVQDDALFAAFCGQVRADIEADLARYDIKDAAALRRFDNTLLSLDLLEGRDQDAQARVESLRAREDKEAQRLTTGLTALAWVAARTAAGADLATPTFRAAFRAALDAQLAPLPIDLVRNNIEALKGRMEIASPALLLGMVQSQIDPVATGAGEISADLAAQVVSLGAALRTVLPLRDEMVASFVAFLAGAPAEPAGQGDIWADRVVALDPARDRLTPVMIAVWDAGVDVPVFGDRVFVNPAEQLDGLDNDGNGFIDDVNGIAFDRAGRPVTELLHPTGDQTDRLPQALAEMKGFTDLQSGVESPEASALRQRMSTMAPADVQPFMEGLGFVGLYAHGTHVAGLALDGNPAAKVLTARISFDYHTIPEPLTRESARRHADSYRSTVDYFKAHGVRVVNMSWGWGLKEIEGMLEANNVGGDAAERSRLAAEYLGILKAGMAAALVGAPDILFVAAAGNDDNDVEFDQSIPGALDLPNLLMVGAVDQAGRRTGFTSRGRRVVIYANGFEVESTIPGGKRMKMSGTSMASPNAANLAAKLIALRPGLTPTQTIDLIKRGADSLEGQEGLLLLNPRASVDLARAGSR